MGKLSLIFLSLCCFLHLVVTQSSLRRKNSGLMISDGLHGSDTLIQRSMVSKISWLMSSMIQIFACSSFVPPGPSYNGITPEQRACAVAGSKPGLDYVNGTAYL